MKTNNKIEIRIWNTWISLNVSEIELTPENVEKIFKRALLAYKKIYNETK